MSSLYNSLTTLRPVDCDFSALRSFCCLLHYASSSTTASSTDLCFVSFVCPSLSIRCFHCQVATSPNRAGLNNATRAFFRVTTAAILCSSGDNFRCAIQPRCLFGLCLRYPCSTTPGYRNKKSWMLCESFRSSNRLRRLLLFSQQNILTLQNILKTPTKVADHLYF